jgi:signal transduction histidine kinase
VMLNLVGNAVKFTDRGGVNIRTETKGGKVLIRVSDTGMGIPKEKLGLVFQEFTQVDTSATRKVGGTGLGLPISQSLVKMHGGRLWAESSGVPGEGAAFFVELPLEARIVETVETAEDEAAGHGKA